MKGKTVLKCVIISIVTAIVMFMVVNYMIGCMGGVNMVTTCQITPQAPMYLTIVSFVISLLASLIAFGIGDKN